LLGRHKVSQKQHDGSIDIDSLDDALLVEDSDGLAKGESGADIGNARGGAGFGDSCVEGIGFILQESCQQVGVRRSISTNRIEILASRPTDSALITRRTRSGHGKTSSWSLPKASTVNVDVNSRRENKSHRSIWSKTV
jgi:hypothetical protein